jgi:ABC-type glycerol-3-phosphate transport system substrate-binding protein
MLYYNQRILDENGVAVPKNFDEYMDAIKSTNKPDKGYYGLSIVTTEHPQAGFDFLEYIQLQGLDPIKDGKYNFTDPDVVKAVDQWRAVVKENAPLGLNSTMNRQLFADGKAAFMVNQPTIWAVVEKGAPEVQKDIRIIPTPFKRTLGDGIVGLHIPAGLDKETQDAAWTLIQFICKPEWQQKLELAVYALSGLDVSLPDEVLSKKPVYAAIAKADRNITPRGPLDKSILENSGEFYQLMTRTGVKLLSSTEPTADILAELQTQVQQVAPLD